MTTKPRRAAETAVSKKIETYQELQRLLKLTKIKHPLWDENEPRDQRRI
jgi:hypothetical protein